ncbi:MAG: HIT domain-containing protein [Planctomycetales bacterium]|nr:HIT domain-containing protein [Planctomycetales bacterium]
MDREILWAPWRLGYIQSAGESDKKSDSVALPAGADARCFMCRAVYGRDDRASLTVLRGEVSFALLNRYPYNNGHLLVAPRRHVGQLGELTDEEHLAMQQQIAHLVQVLGQEIKAEGFNVGLNLGHVAGAGVPGHLHWHIVPRWNGDVNFMASVAGAKVIPQSLDSLWELLKQALP